MTNRLPSRLEETLKIAQIFDSGFKGINRNQYEVFRLQNQLSTGRRVLTPQDDPIAAAQALVLTQAQSVAEQHLTNQEDAQNKLGVAENQLNALGDLLQNVREKLVQAAFSRSRSPTRVRRKADRCAPQPSI